jgi:hypothetical protein
MTDQQGWGPPQQPTWDQTQQQPYGVPQQHQHQQPPGFGYPPPQQGYPMSGPGRRGPKKRHTVRNVILGVVGAIVLIIIIGAVASSHNGVTKAPPAAKAATKHSSTGSQQPAGNSTTGPVGTTFVVTDTNESGATVKYSVTLDKLKQHAAPDNQFDTPPAGDHLAGAEFTIKGISGTDSDDANNDAAATGTDQQTYQTGAEGLAAGTNFNSGQFSTSAGSVSIGWVSFEVKNGVHVATVQWNPDSDMSGEAPATWTVG